MVHLHGKASETPSDAGTSPLNHRVRLLKGMWKLRVLEDSASIELRPPAEATRDGSLNPGRGSLLP